MNERYFTAVTTGRSFLRHTTATLGTAAILTAGTIPAVSVSPSLDSTTNISPNVYGTAHDIIGVPGIPEEISGVLNKGTDFLTGEREGESGLNVPDQVPKTNQFLLSTVADKYIGDEGRSLGLTTTVLDPADLPLSGVLENQPGFTSTSLGAKQLAKEQSAEMNVYRVNIASSKCGKATLKNNGTNAEEGSGAVSGAADTDKGLVIAIMQGGITTQGGPGPINCSYTPITGVFPIGLN